MIKPVSMALLIASALTLMACDQNKSASSTENLANTEKQQTTQMANPASEYCVSIGGDLEIQTQTDGQIGICHLPSGEKIEEWALYRKANKQEITKAVDMVNPAAAYCESVDGKLDLPTGVCTLPSGEALDQWALFKREHDQSQNKPQIGIANPAAVYCESVDGKLDLPTGVCTLPSGEALDQWELYKREHDQSQNMPQIGIANPAA